jgi:FlaA1/EpsC-like NDP-sugar epimerase
MLKEYPKWLLYVREKAQILFSRYSLPKWMLFVTDNLAVFLVFLLAYLLRFNFDITAINHSIAIYHGLIALCVYAVFSLIFRSYSGLLRHTTLTDVSMVFIVTTFSSASLLLITLGTRSFGWDYHLEIPISIILIHYVTITVVLFFERVTVKVIFRFATSSLQNTRNVLIYGAGDLGFVVKRVIMSDPKYGFYVKGFIDNDKNLYGKKINGIPVYGISSISADFVLKNKIESLILAEQDNSFINQNGD